MDSVTRCPYLTGADNFNNFKTDYAPELGLFEYLNYTVKDYHNGSTGPCNLGSSGTGDDVKRINQLHERL